MHTVGRREMQQVRPVLGQQRRTGPVGLYFISRFVLYMYAHLHYTHKHTRTHTNSHRHRHRQTHTHTHTHARTHARTHTCIYILWYIYIPLVVGKCNKSGRCFASSDVLVLSLAKPPVASTVSCDVMVPWAPVLSSVYETPVTRPVASKFSLVARQPVRIVSCPVFWNIFTWFMDNKGSGILQ